MATPPEINQLVATLAELSLQNSATAVSSRIRAWRSRTDNEAVINELIELVNELISEKAEIVSVAHALEQQVSTQRISEAEITYITEKLIPTAERLVAKTSSDEDVSETVEILKEIVSTETLIILQLVGFNFKQAIGQPLTELVERSILGQVPNPPSEELQALTLKHESALFEVLTDADASVRLQQWMQGSFLATHPDSRTGASGSGGRGAQPGNARGRRR